MPKHTEPDLSNFKPKRSIGTTYSSISGLYPFKQNEAVAFESTLERDFLIRLETFESVLNVVSQPLTIEYNDQNGKPRHYTPDYLVQYKAFPWPFRPYELIEVKPRSKLKKHISQWKPKYKAAIKFCKQHDYVFHLMDENRIRDQRWKNAMFLQRYRKMQFDSADTQWIINHLKKMGTATFDYLLSRHFFGENDKAIGISLLWHLVANKLIECDLSLPLSPKTELWVITDERT